MEGLNPHLLCLLHCQAGSYTPPYTLSDSEPEGERDIIYSDRELNELPPDRIELTDEEKLNLAQEYIAQCGGSEAPENYTVLCFKTLSNGMSVVYVQPNEGTYPTVLIMSTFGKYIYRHGGGRSVKLYQNGVYTEIYDAYINGLIDDAIIEELNEVMHFDRYAEQSATAKPEETTQPVEETTKPAETTTAAGTTAETTTAPKTTKPLAQGDSTIDSAYKGGSGSGANGTIATGDDTSLAIIIAAALSAVSGISLFALRRKG